MRRFRIISLLFAIALAPASAQSEETRSNMPTELEIVVERLVAQRVGNTLCTDRNDDAGEACRNAFMFVDVNFVWALVALKTREYSLEIGRDGRRSAVLSQQLVDLGNEAYKAAVSRYDSKKTPH